MQSLEVRPSARNHRQGVMKIGPLTLKVALGRSGVGSFKREGDGHTPRGPLRLLYGFWRSDRIARPVTQLPMLPSRKTMVWCDDPKSPTYNRLSRLPLKESHETMCRADQLYDIVIVMDWNVSSRRRGAGSAIFLHLARPGFMPTEGCIAVRERDMRRLLAVADARTVIHVK
ncbi:L,D-peptidoglycan transpeptidase YkuD (ErfK/YbiS/YcfS/YnhG family) [Rhizobium aquaticum]|uniref:L,D-peptidoglycan transpeptidase YkuD (ErfK/YbiS/YcfS/YnhG family) n=1 Tax=Rhizobium aquaticum TaxID=1549636 RepID=A0ABV2J3Z1_9HYPH